MSIQLMGVAALCATAAPAALAQCSWSETPVHSSVPSLGWALDLDDRTAVLGAPLASPFGAESGFARVLDGESGWSGAVDLVPPTPAAGQRLGSAVAVDGSWIAVGTPTSSTVLGGSVHLFERNQGGLGAWGWSAQLVGSGAPNLALFGSALDLCGDRLAVGGYYTDGLSGRVWIFERDAASGQWTQSHVISASDSEPLSYFGSAVSLHGDLLLVGAPHARGLGGVRTGAAYLYSRNRGGPNAWGEVAKFFANDGELDDRYGSSVTLGPATAAIGSPQDNDLAYNSGAVYVQSFAAPSWSFTRKLRASDGGFAHGFGGALSLVGDELLVGARSAAVRGQAYVFERNHGGLNAWGERERLQPANLQPNTWFFGTTVALAPGLRVVGAPGTTAAGSSASAYFYAAPEQVREYGVGSGRSFGCDPRVSLVGCASSTPGASFRLRAHGVHGGRIGMLVYSVNGRASLPWGAHASALSLQPPLQRGRLQPTGGTSGECDGVLELEWSSFISSHPYAEGQPFHAGQTICVQAIWRDGAELRHSRLSPALEFTLLP